MPVQLTSELFDMTDVTAINPRIVVVPGEKIDLVLLEEHDVRRLTAFMNDPEVTKYLLRYLPLSLEMEIEWIRTRGKDNRNVVFGIVVKGENTVIGTTGIHNIDFRSGTAGFGLSIGDTSEWGKGFGTEATRLMTKYAFYHLNLRAIRLEVYESNAPARRVYEKCGFVVVGTLPQWLYLSPGVYDNEIMMVCVRPK